MLDPSKINPGIRRTVSWLNENSFETCDSGDGVTRDFDCDPGFPYVVMRVHWEKLIDEADRLLALLEMAEVRVEGQDDQGKTVGIQASYTPNGQAAELMLVGLTDAKLLPASNGGRG